MSQISVINAIEVPPDHVDAAIRIRNDYVDYFRTKPGFVSSTFYRASNAQQEFQFINIIVWESEEAFQAVVNEGFSNAEGMNDDGRRVLGKGFPPPIRVHPGQYEVIDSD